MAAAACGAQRERTNWEEEDSHHCRGGNPHATAQAGAAGPVGVAASVLGDKPNGDADKPKAGDGKRARQGVPKS